MAGQSTASRTIQMLRDEGWMATLVERYNIYSKNYNDLFGFADVMAMHPLRGVLLIQVTSGGHVNERLKKMRNEALEAVECAVVAPGVEVEVHGWRKIKACTRCRGQRFGADRECECTKPKPGTRVTYKPIIKKVDKEALYAMDTSDWEVISSFLHKAVRLVDPRGDDKWDASAVVMNYPPAIAIRISLKAGVNDGNAINLSRSERQRAASLATQACQEALAEHHELRLVRAWAAFGRHPCEVEFRLRPHNYEDLAKELAGDAS